MKNYSTDSQNLVKKVMAFIYFLHFFSVLILYFSEKVAFLQCEDQLMGYSVYKTFYTGISAMGICFIKCV